MIPFNVFFGAHRIVVKVHYLVFVYTDETVVSTSEAYGCFVGLFEGKNWIWISLPLEIEVSS